MLFRKNTCQRGEVAEIVFIERAVRLGYTVSKPYGNSAPYDVVIGGSSRRLKRVQVKSAWTIGWLGAYCASAQHSAAPVYTIDEIDLLAAYAVPEDAWYIIPVTALCRKPILLYPHDPARDGRWGRYREAWSRLGRPGPAPPQFPAVLRRNRLPANLQAL